MPRLEALSPHERKFRKQQALELAQEIVAQEIKTASVLKRPHLHIARESRATKIAHDIERIHERTGLFVDAAIGLSRGEIKVLAGRGILAEKKTPDQVEDAVIKQIDKRVRKEFAASEHLDPKHWDHHDPDLHTKEHILEQITHTLKTTDNIPEFVATQIYQLEHQIEHDEERVHSGAVDQADIPAVRQQIQANKIALKIFEGQHHILAAKGLDTIENQKTERNLALQRFDAYANFDQALREGVILLEPTTEMANLHIDLPPQAHALAAVVENVREEFVRSTSGRIFGKTRNPFINESFLTMKVRAGINQISDPGLRAKVEQMLKDAGRSERDIARGVYEQIREYRVHNEGLANLDTWFNTYHTKAVGNVAIAHMLKYPRSKVASWIYDIPVVRGVYDYGSSAVRNMRVIAPAAVAIGLGVGAGAATLTNPWLWGIVGAAFVADHMRKRKVLQHQVKREVLEGKRLDATSPKSDGTPFINRFTDDYRKDQIFDRLFREDDYFEKHRVGEYTESEGIPHLERVALTQEVGAGSRGSRSGLLDRVQDLIVPDTKVNKDKSEVDIPYARFTDMQPGRDGRPLGEANMERAIALLAEITARMRVFEHGKVAAPFTKINGMTLQQTAYQLSQGAQALTFSIERVKSIFDSRQTDLTTKLAGATPGSKEYIQYQQAIDGIHNHLNRLAHNKMLAKFIDPATGEIKQEELKELTRKIERKLDPTREVFGMQYWGENMLNNNEARRAFFRDRLVNGLQTGVVTAAAIAGGLDLSASAVHAASALLP